MAVDDVIGRELIVVGHIGQVAVQLQEKMVEVSVWHADAQIEQQTHQGVAAHGQQAAVGQHIAGEMSVLAYLALCKS